MPGQPIIPIILSQGNLYASSLIAAAVVNFMLAFLLLLDSNNDIYSETPCYQRARILSGVSILVFGVGFFLHWLFMPHFTNLLLGKAISFSYFHIGGVLFSMSHTNLIDRHYYSRQVVVRDVSILFFSLVVYWVNAFIADITLTYLGSALFFLHIGYLTYVFYSHFFRIYRQLGSYADYIPNDTDHEVLWLHYSCHLIIVFGIGGMLCTVLFHDAVTPFTMLLFMGIVVFTYIYKSLESFSVVAFEAEDHIEMSEDYLPTATDQQTKIIPLLPTDDVREVMERVEQWVAGRHYTKASITIKDALEQMGITEHALNYYLETHSPVQGYRQWLSYLRVEEAKRLMLDHPGYSFQAVAELCGYSSNSTLTRSFKLIEGISPESWYRKENPNYHRGSKKQ